MYSAVRLSNGVKQPGNAYSSHLVVCEIPETANVKSVDGPMVADKDIEPKKNNIPRLSRRLKTRYERKCKWRRSDIWRRLEPSDFPKRGFSLSKRAWATR